MNMEGIIIPEPTAREEAEAVKETELKARTREAEEGDKLYLISNRCD